MNAPSEKENSTDTHTFHIKFQMIMATVVNDKFVSVCYSLGSAKYLYVGQKEME